MAIFNSKLLVYQRVNTCSHQELLKILGIACGEDYHGLLRQKMTPSRSQSKDHYPVAFKFTLTYLMFLNVPKCLVFSVKQHFKNEVPVLEYKV